MRNDNDERNHHNDAGALRRYCYRIRPEQPWMLRMWPLAFICMYTKKGWRRRIHRIELSSRRRKRRRATGGAFAQYRIKIGIANPIVSTTKEGRKEGCTEQSTFWSFALLIPVDGTSRLLTLDLFLYFEPIKVDRAEFCLSSVPRTNRSWR